jgi:hypothetical protein
MKSFNMFINEIYEVITKKHTLFEFMLNLTFVLILVVIGVVFYWDTINRSVVKTSRCKIILNNDDITYNLQFFNKDNVKLYNLSYDNTSEHNVKIDCSCPKGDMPNKFTIPFYNDETKKITNNIQKHCFCDNNYTENSTKYQMDGDAFLVDYYKDIYKTYGGANDFTGVDQYNTNLIFPN